MNFRKTLKLQGIRLAISRYEDKEENPWQLCVRLDKSDLNYDVARDFNKELREFVEIAEENDMVIADTARKGLGFKPFKKNDVVQVGVQVAYFRLSKDETRVKLEFEGSEIPYGEGFKYIGDANIFVNSFETKKGLVFVKTVCAVRVTGLAPYEGGEIAEDLEGAEGF